MKLWAGTSSCPHWTKRHQHRIIKCKCQSQTWKIQHSVSYIFGTKTWEVLGFPEVRIMLQFSLEILEPILKHTQRHKCFLWLWRHLCLRLRKWRRVVVKALAHFGGEFHEVWHFGRGGIHCCGLLGQLSEWFDWDADLRQMRLRGEGAEQRRYLGTIAYREKCVHTPVTLKKLINKRTSKTTEFLLPSDETKVPQDVKFKNKKVHLFWCWNLLFFKLLTLKMRLGFWLVMCPTKCHDWLPSALGIEK